MVRIITGPVDSGKTSRMERLYRSIGTGDGFLLRKQIMHGLFTGQRIERITTGQGMDFSYKLSYTPNGWDEADRYKDFSFSASGLAYADKIIWDAREKGMDPLFIDEIGPLELGRRCFYTLFTDMLIAETNLYITVRSSCLYEVIRFFNLEAAGYEILY